MDAVELLRDPGPSRARFGARLRQVLSASLVDDAVDEDDPVPKPELTLDDDLRRKLEAAAKRRSANPFGEHPEGIGPTLGMDVGKS